ncbi:MAG: elongation factor P--(R)-beta-lysine ligase [Persephonella sp.]|nr:MAG: elongation factor P--(R)-beta-lysine ligase [Persephonella sp.]
MINTRFLKARSRILKAIRNYFELTGATEVLTDILRDYPNLDSNVYPLELKYFKSDGVERTGYLHTSPEYEMKKILSELKEDIYQITKVFRNYEGSKIHKTEFLMLEWYRVDYDLFDLIEDTKNIFIQSAIAIHKKPKIVFKGVEYDLTDWEILTVEDAFKKYIGVDIYDNQSIYSFLEKSKIKHSNLNPNDWKEMFFILYSFYLEEKLGKEKPVIIYNYPKELGALSEVEGKIAKRFEAYINGVELVNGYQELRDEMLLRNILINDIEEKYQSTGKKYSLDEEFIKSVKNLPKCSGASLGLDRLFMVILDMESVY